MIYDLSVLWPPERDRHYEPLTESEMGELIDGDLELVLVETGAARPTDRWAASHTFAMVDRGSGERAGVIQLRLADTEELLFFGGHVGFSVDEPFQGRRFAARSVQLVLPLARRAGMPKLWITCSPENRASQRSIEIAGGQFVESIPIPETSPMYQAGHRESRRYCFKL